MNTRRASDDAPFRQERYMSSPEMVRGLLANCVAARVQTLAAPLHRKLIWWMQKASWQPGGTAKVAETIIARWPDRFTTPTILRLGVGPDRIYDSAEVKEARNSLKGTPVNGDAHHRTFRRSFNLSGENEEEVGFSWFLSRDWTDKDFRKRSDRRTEKAKELRLSRSYPKSYPASAFAEYCLEEARENLATFFAEELCLNPAVELNEETLWYFPQFVETLIELYEETAGAAGDGRPVTEIGAKVEECLEYALAERGLVVIDGVARTGKTKAVEAFCDAHPGEARYVQVPSSNDEISFNRAICDALGIGSSRAYKALELRAKVEAVLQTGDLLLVMDEGHYLWPQGSLRRATPHRINWMLTQLVNKGVPVAVVTTPQFTKSQETLVKSGGWSSEQLIGRIMHYKRLPGKLGEDDLEAVARYWMPGGDEDSIRVLITYAQTSERYLQGIEALVRRSRWQAARAGREEPIFADVEAALHGGVVPSDNALTAALSVARKTVTRKAGRPALQPLSPAPQPSPFQAPCKASAKRVQTPSEAAFTAPARDAGESVLSP